MISSIIYHLCSNLLNPLIKNIHNTSQPIPKLVTEVRDKTEQCEYQGRRQKARKIMYQPKGSTVKSTEKGSENGREDVEKEEQSVPSTTNTLTDMMTATTTTKAVRNGGKLRQSRQKLKARMDEIRKERKEKVSTLVMDSVKKKAGILDTRGNTLMVDWLKAGVQKGRSDRKVVQGSSSSGRMEE